MAYQNVGTPRFYLNVLEWLNVNGKLDINDVFRTSPANFKLYNNANYAIPSETFNSKAFIAILGHTLTSNNYNASLQSDGANLSVAEIVNIGGSGNNVISPEYDGWSLATTNELEDKDDVSVNLTGTNRIYCSW